MEKEFEKSLLLELGYNNLIDDDMIQTWREETVRDAIIEGVQEISLRIGVRIDDNLIKEWFRKCKILDKIEDFELIDFAAKRRIIMLCSENAKIRKKMNDLEQDYYQLHRRYEELIYKQKENQ